MGTSNQVVENEGFVGLAGRGGFLNFPIKAGAEEVCYNINPEIYRSITFNKNWFKDKHFKVKNCECQFHLDLFGDNRSPKGLRIKRNPTDLFRPEKTVSGSTLLESSYLLYGKAVEYSRNYQLHSTQALNEFNADILKLEVVISSELKSLFKEEDKWTSLFDFAEEYKKAFGISDEELWLEFGSELLAIQSEIEAIGFYKKSIYVSKSYIERAKRIFYNTSWETRSIRRCEIRHHIAFSTKNLDDEHNSGVNTSSRLCFTQSENVFNEKNYYNKAFAFGQ